MTLSSSIAKVSHNGNGITTVFGFAYYFLLDTDLVVVLVDADGTEHTQTLNSHYTVSGAGNPSGGTVTMGAAPASGKKLVVKRRPAITQTTDYAANDAFPAQAHEDALDRRAMVEQSLQEQVDRAVRAPIGEMSPMVLLPPVADRANKALVFDADGDVTVSADDYADQAAEAAASAAAAAASASAASGSASAASSSAAAAAASASAAATAETNAETAETNAETAETNAEAAQAAAEAAATNAAASAALLIGTSTSSVAIGTGSKGFTTQAGKFFGAGTWLLIASDADPTDFMHGHVTAYSGTSLTVEVTNIGGAGTHTDWTIRVAGTRGAEGAQGPEGPEGDTGPQGPAGSGTGDLLAANNLSDVASASTARTNLGVAIGTHVQGYSAKLAAIDGATWAANKLLYLTGTGTVGTIDLPANSQSLLASADYAAMRTALGLTVGTNVQAYDADLGALAANSTNGLWARTGAGTGAARTLTGTTNRVSVSNGDGASGNPTITLTDTAVTPGSYTNTSLTVTQDGRITAASNGSGGGPFSSSSLFTSSDQTITAGGALTLAHGLASTPKFFALTLVCQSAEYGYSIADLVAASGNLTGGASDRGVSVVPDSTNLVIRYGSAAATLAVPNKTNGNSTGMTNGNWKTRFYAWY